MSRASETRTGDRPGRSAPLGDVEPAGSRHRGRRSAVAFAGDAVVVGRADGSVVAFDAATLERRWSADGDGSAVTIVPLEPGDGGGDGSRQGDGDGTAVAVGERSVRGAVRVLDPATGEPRWHHETAVDVGSPDRDTRFFLPFVVDAVAASSDRTGDGRAGDTGTGRAGDTGTGRADDMGGLYVAARRYERRDGGRAFESVVYAFEPDGTERWRYRTDASPISLDLAGDRLAVACNRCPGSHDDGLVVLDAATGDQRWRWDPPAPGERRVGDVCLYSPAAGDTRSRPQGDDGSGGSRSGVPSGTGTGGRGGAVVTSHADYRGYGLEPGGDVRWTADLATPIRRDGDTVYAYPNHVHATAEGVAFVTGNTYPKEGRETDARHPLAHSIVGYAGGERRWTDAVGGFANGIATDGPTVAVPSAQAFRERDAETHAVGVFDVSDGRRRSLSTDGVVTAAALSTDCIAALEEPVRYHDEGTVRGDYRVHVLDR